MKTTELQSLCTILERKLRRKLTDGQFALLLGYAKKTGSPKEAHSRLWELMKRDYVPTSVERRCDELRELSAKELRLRAKINSNGRKNS